MVIDVESFQYETSARANRWSLILASYAVHCLAVLMLPAIGLIEPIRFEANRPQYPVQLVSVTPYSEPEPYRPVTLPRQLVQPAPVLNDNSIVSDPPAPSPVAAGISASSPKLPDLNISAARSRLPVSINSFPTPALPRTNKPMAQVQTGGFGDPKGLPGEGKLGAHLPVARIGSFDLPPGPGNGNGTGGGTGVKGVVTTTTFGTPTDGHTPPAARRGNGNGGGTGVQQAGFGDATVATGPGGGKPGRGGASPAKVVPAEILYKPIPTYTDEARSLKLEGEVLAEVLFPASGQPRVIRVIHGLGHGLDEAAAEAISKIRFKPAQQEGQPVDSTAIVHIVFKLA